MRYRLKTHTVDAFQWTGNINEAKVYLPLDVALEQHKNGTLDIRFSSGRLISMLPGYWLVARELDGKMSFALFNDHMFKEAYESAD